jgi:hypothetical protein
MSMGEVPVTETPIAVDNVRRIVESMGFKLSDFPEQIQKPVMDFIVQAFDWYTRQGLDFGSAAIRAWIDLLKQFED